MGAASRVQPERALEIVAQEAVEAGDGERVVGPALARARGLEREAEAARKRCHDEAEDGEGHHDLEEREARLAAGAARGPAHDAGPSASVASS